MSQEFTSKYMLTGAKGRVVLKSDQLIDERAEDACERKVDVRVFVQVVSEKLGGRNKNRYPLEQEERYVGRFDNLQSAHMAAEEKVNEVLRERNSSPATDKAQALATKIAAKFGNWVDSGSFSDITTRHPFWDVRLPGGTRVILSDPMNSKLSRKVSIGFWKEGAWLGPSQTFDIGMTDEDIILKVFPE